MVLGAIGTDSTGAAVKIGNIRVTSRMDIGIYRCEIVAPPEVLILCRVRALWADQEYSP